MARTRAYVERVPSGILFVALVVVAVVTGGTGVAQLVRGPLGSDPAPTWFYLGFAAVFGFLALAFRRLVVRLDRQGVRVAYGVFRRQIAWRDVESVDRDEPAAFFGYGVRFGRNRGRWVWVFNVIGGPRVVVTTFEGGPASLIFSTRRPDEVLAVAHEHLQSDGRGRPRRDRRRRA